MTNKSVALDSGDVRVRGSIAPGFDAVIEAFADNFRQYGEVGAACSLYHRGRCVVDI
jgi:hypothetical protein